MDGSYFARLCLAGSFVGLLAMGLLLYFYKVKEIEIEELQDYDGEDRIRMKGTVTSIEELEKVTIVEISHDAKVSVTAFDDGVLKLTPGEQVRIEGRVQEYKGQKQLVADEIVRVG